MKAEDQGEVAAGVLVVDKANRLEVTRLKLNNRLQRRDVGDQEPAPSVKRGQK